MTNKIIEAWNAQADHMNQWDSLGEDEKIAWVYRQALDDAARACRPFGKTGAVVAAAIKALKEQQHG